MTFTHDFSVFLHESGALRFGKHRLSSGQESQYYIDLRKVLGNPRQYSLMIQMLAGEIARRHGSDPNQVLVGVPTGGLAVASALAYASGRPLAYVRSQVKDYGTGKQIEGANLTPGSLAIVIDDVISTGSSIMGALEPLETQGIWVRHVYTIVDRMMGGRERLAEHEITLHSLLTIEDIVTCLVDEDRISQEVADGVLGGSAATVAAPT